MSNNFEKSKYSGGISGGGGGNDPIYSSDTIDGKKRLYGGDMVAEGLYELFVEIHKTTTNLISKEETFTIRKIYADILQLIFEAIIGIFNAVYIFALLYLGLTFGYQRVDWSLVANVLFFSTFAYLLLRFLSNARVSFSGLVKGNLIIILGYMWGLSFYRNTHLLFKLIGLPHFNV